LLLLLWRGLLLLLRQLLLLAWWLRADAASHCTHNGMLLLLQLM
jgi:hypothetical protein